MERHWMRPYILLKQINIIFYIVMKHRVEKCDFMSQWKELKIEIGAKASDCKIWKFHHEFH